MSTGLKRLNEQSYNPGLNGNIMDPLVHIPFKRQDDEKALSGLQSFSRASTATYVDPLDGLVKTALADTPRFERMSDGGTGILMEGDSTNLVIQSTNMLASNWLSFLGSSVTTATSPSPSGSMDAFTLTFNGTANGQVVNGIHGLVVGATYVLSAYIKNTIAGQKLSVAQAPIGGILQTLWQPSDVWTRQTIKFVAAATSVNLYFVTGNIGSIDIWGAQLEPLPFASSYIPTTTAPVTRASDGLSILASGNVPQIMSQHTIIADAETFGIIPGAFQTIAGSIFNVTPDMHDLRILQVGIPYAQSRFGDQLITNSVNPIIFNHVYRLAISNTGSSLVGYSDGTLIQASPAAVTSNIIPVSTFNIGSYLGGVGSLYGHIRNFRIYDRALTATEVLVA